MAEKHLALHSQLNASGVSGEKGKPQALLQLADGLADGRLADKQFLGGL